MKTLLIHSLIIVSMMVSAPALAQGDPLRVGMSGQYFPFTFVEQDTLKGFEVDVMNAVAEEMGDLLFCVVNLARHLGVDAENALRQGNAKFERRFRFIEAQLGEQGATVSERALDELDALWDKAKQQGL